MKKTPYITENTLDKREARVSAAINLTEGDRVPFAPKVNLVYAQDAGITKGEALFDFRTMCPGVERFLQKYEPDLFWAPADYSSSVMEVLGTTAIRWPGATWNLDRNSSFQIVDKSYMDIDEYDEMIKNPAHFFMTKVWARKHSRLKGLEKLNFNAVIEFGHYASMAAFSDPEVKEALMALMFAGEKVAANNAALARINEIAIENHTPLCCIIGNSAPYDMLADNIRGYMNVPMDILEEPKKVLAAIDVMTDMAIENIKNAAAMGLKYMFMPLHGGTDDFMSNDTYLEFYWPSLKTVIDKTIELGMTPYIFFEGKYNTRLEILRDHLPKGKCIGMFEQVDIAHAKSVLKDTMCICGNLPGASLIYGKPEEIRESTKRMLDACAPGGGFIMDTSIVLDDYKPENMDAFYETTMKYGKY